MNNVQIRPSTNIVISKTDAEYYIENSTTNLEILPTSYYEIFPNSSKYTGYSTNSSIGDFFNALNSHTTESSSILGGIIDTDKNNQSNYIQNDPLDYANIKSNQSAIYGQRGAENIGLAVFKDDKLIGELNARETLCYSIISNKLSSFFIAIEDPQNENKFIDLCIYCDYPVTSRVNIINSSPFIDVECKFNAKVYSITNNEDYLDDKKIKQISISASRYLETQIYDYLYITSKIFRSDISGFGKSALLCFKTTKDFENYNWLKNYQNSFFKVKCNVDVKSSVLITQI